MKDNEPRNIHRLWARELTDAELNSERRRLNQLADTFFDEDPEDVCHGGSPGESMFERLDEVEHEWKKRRSSTTIGAPQNPAVTGERDLAPGLKLPSQEWLTRHVETDPDLDCEVGSPSTTPCTFNVEGLAERLTLRAREHDLFGSRKDIVLFNEAATALRDLRDDHHRRGVKIIEFTEIAGTHLCRAEVAEADNARLREELSLARSLIVNAYPDAGDGTFDEVSLADLVRMVVGERDGLLRRGDVIDMLIRLGANHADQAIYGEEANARQREAMEAAFTHARCAVALMPTIGAK